MPSSLISKIRALYQDESHSNGAQQISPTLKALRTECDSEEEYKNVKSFVSLSRSGESFVSSCTQKCPGLSIADTNTAKKSFVFGNCTTPVTGEAEKEDEKKLVVIEDTCGTCTTASNVNF